MEYIFFFFFFIHVHVNQLLNKVKLILITKKNLTISDKTVTIVEPCATKASVFALSVTCALLVLIYIATIFSYYLKKWMTPRKILS